MSTIKEKIVGGLFKSKRR